MKNTQIKNLNVENIQELTTEELQMIDGGLIMIAAGVGIFMAGYYLGRGVADAIWG